MDVSPARRYCKLLPAKPEPAAKPGAIILIDGECVLCHRLARFVLRRDHRVYFRFGALQSPAAQRLLQGHAALDDALSTVVVIEQSDVLTHSDATLRVLQRLPWPWPWLAWLRIVPRPWRDAAYRWLGRNRYRWFGRREVCLLPEDWPPQRRLDKTE